MQSLATNIEEGFAFIAASTTGWRPCLTIKLRLSFNNGLTQPSFIASSASAEATSISAIETARSCRAQAWYKTLAVRLSNIPNSNFWALPAAFKIFVSNSPRSTVVKRTALAVVCLWMKVSFRGAASIRSACVAVVSMK